MLAARIFFMHTWYVFMSVFSYFFWPRPDKIGYDNPELMALLYFSVFLILLAFVFKYWRRSLKNTQTKKLSKSWSFISAWFGSIGVVLAVSRAEDISYVSMRIWWVVWFIIFILLIFLQIRLFRARHYNVLPKEHVNDPRMKYLPKKKK